MPPIVVALLEQADVRAQLRRGHRRREPSGPGAQHDDVVVGHQFSSHPRSHIRTNFRSGQVSNGGGDVSTRSSGSASRLCRRIDSRPDFTLSHARLACRGRSASEPREEGAAPMAGGPLEGKVAIVTGAAMGMGEATARVFAAAGAQRARERHQPRTRPGDRRAASSSDGGSASFCRTDVSKAADARGHGSHRGRALRAARLRGQQRRGHARHPSDRRARRGRMRPDPRGRPEGRRALPQVRARADARAGRRRSDREHRVGELVPAAAGQRRVRRGQARRDRPDQGRVARERPAGDPRQHGLPRARSTPR